MELITAGCNPALGWFASRLSRQGHTVTPLESVPAALAQACAPGEVSCLLADRLLLALAPSRPAALALDRFCRQRDLAFAELTGPWQSFGSESGFILMTGMDTPPPPACQTILDALSPLPGSWLRTGPVGSAGYTATLLDSLVFSCTLASQATWAIPGEAIRTPDWEEFLVRQRRLADQLLALSLDYLGTAADQPLDTQALLADFAKPPHQQAHFAETLARIMVLALRHGHAVDELFGTLGTFYRRNAQ